MFALASRIIRDVVILDLKGPLNGGTESLAVGDLIRKQLSQGHRKFILNFAQVPWISSLGVGFLVGAYTSAKKMGADLTIANLSYRVARVFEVTGVVPGLFEASASVEEAVNGLAAGPGRHFSGAAALSVISLDKNSESTKRIN